MYNIYEALKSGQTPEQVAQTFVDELNAALKRQEADQAAAEAEAQKKAQQENDLIALVDHLNNYLKIYYPSIKPMSAKEFTNVIEGVLELDNIINDIVTTTNESSFDEVIGNFFNKFGL